MDDRKYLTDITTAKVREGERGRERRKVPRYGV